MFKKTLVLLILAGLLVSGASACKKKETTLKEPEGTVQKEGAEVKGTATPETPPPLPSSPPTTPPVNGSAPAAGEGNVAPTPPPPPPPPPPPSTGPN